MMNSRTLLHVCILIALSGVLFFWGLGAMGLTDRDEGRNAEAGREMYETGDWISPTFNYEPRYAKPALVYWLMSGSYHVFGVNEWAARLPSALFGLGLILLTYAFLARVREHTTALIGALMLLLNVQIISLSRMALTDSVVIFFTTLSLYAFWLALQAPGRRPMWLWTFYGGMALGTLTKGPIGFLVPLLTAGVYLTATKQWRLFWQEGKPLAGAALFTLIALPWYLAMWSLHGADYAASAQANTVGRFLNPMEGHSFALWFYFPVLLLGFFPWSGWLPFAWHAAFVSWRTARRGPAPLSAPHTGGAPDPRLDWFAAVWVLTTFVFFTLSSTRLPHYIGPLFPAAAILTAGYWSRCTTERGTRGAAAAIHTVMLTGLLLAGAFASLPWAYDSWVAGKLTKEFPLATQFFLGNGPYAAATVLFIGMALVGYFGLSEQRRGGAFWAAGGSLACIVLIVMQLILPGVNRVFIAPSQELAYAAGLNLAPEDRLIAYGSTRPSLAFYARRKVEFIPANEVDRLRQALTDKSRTMIILPETVQASLPREATTYQPILKRYGYLLLASEPMVKTPEGMAISPGPPAVVGH